MEKIQDLETKLIEFSNWNPNEMSREKFEALKDDLQKNGQLYPIIVMFVKGEIRKADLKVDPYNLLTSDHYQVVEGNHRLKAADELGWKKIKAIVQKFKNVDDALLLNFRANAARGQHNPYKEGEIFRYLLSPDAPVKRSQADLAKQLGIDRTTIAKRLSLLKIDNEMRRRLEELVPQITVSQLEMIAPCSAETQKEICKAIKREYKDGELTVRNLREIISLSSGNGTKRRPATSVESNLKNSDELKHVIVNLHKVSNKYPFSIDANWGGAGQEYSEHPSKSREEALKTLGTWLYNKTKKEGKFHVTIINKWPKQK